MDVFSVTCKIFTNFNLIKSSVKLSVKLIKSKREREGKKK